MAIKKTNWKLNKRKLSLLSYGKYNLS